MSDPTRRGGEGDQALRQRSSDRFARARRIRGRVRGRRDRRQPRAARPGARTSRCTPSPAASGGGSSSPASCSATPQTLLLDEPTNHLDADSIVWLRDHLKNYRGGLMVISHDVDLVEQVVNKVFYLDANRSVLDIYNVGWKAYLTQRETDERRRKRERANAEKQASALQLQAAKMRAKATKAKAAQNMARRAERLLSGLEDERQADKVAKLRFPEPAPCGKTPLTADRAVEVLRLAGDLHRRRPRHRPGLPGRHARPQRRGQDHPAAHAGRGREAGHRRGHPRPRPKARLLRAGARDARPRAVRPGEHAHRRARARPTPRCAKSSAPSCSPATMSTSRSACSPAARRPGSRWRPWWSPARTCCCSTSRRTTWTRPAARRSSARCARYKGAVVLVTHDEGAVDALAPERIILLPDGVEDLWWADYADLVALA